MRISGIGGPAIGAAGRRTAAATREPGIAEPRALIAVAAAVPSERPPTLTRYPAAPFLAQLIATRMQAPQTCARRRAEPAEAISIYAAAGAPRTVPQCRLGKRA